MVYGLSRAFLVDFWTEIRLPTGLSAVSWALSGRKGRKKPLKDPLVTKFRPKSRPTYPETDLKPHLDSYTVPARIRWDRKHSSELRPARSPYGCAGHGLAPDEESGTPELAAAHGRETEGFAPLPLF